MDTDTPETAFSDAFDIGRSLSHGWASLKRCFPVLFVGGCLKSVTEGGGGGSAPDPKLFQSDLGGPLAGLSVNVILTIVAVILVIVILVVAFRSWLVPGWYRLHRQI